MSVISPEQINAAFADAFNSGKVENLLALYEPDAVLRTDASDRSPTGLKAIGEELGSLISAGGTMRSVNNFCIVHGDIALLRADWALADKDGAIVATGSSAELVRRQADGRWLYVIDHAVGAVVPRVAALDAN